MMREGRCPALRHGGSESVAMKSETLFQVATAVDVLSAEPSLG